jgi:hypothetical protein
MHSEVHRSCKPGAISGRVLTALNASCPLRLNEEGRLYLQNMLLGPEDIQGLSTAWAPALTRLDLSQCLLYPAAWAALPSGSLTSLKELVLVDMQEPHQLGMHLLAFCMAWPRKQHLKVTVRESGASEWLATCTAILQGHGRDNVEITDDAA